MRIILTSLIAACCLVSMSFAQQQLELAEGTVLNVSTLSDNFTDPTSISIDSDGFVWVADRVTGKIWRMNAGGWMTLVGTVELTHDAENTEIQGFLFDVVVTRQQPGDDFTVFTMTTIIGDELVIESRSYDGVLLGSPVEILRVSEVPHTSGHAMSVLSDGTLLVSVGSFDGTQPGDLRNLNGKLLRINPDGTAPLDNPLYDANDPTAASNYVYSYGHRQMAGMAQIPAMHGSLAGSIFAVEPGAKSRDEVNLIVPGANHGWRHTAGFCKDEVQTYVCPKATFNLVPSSVAYYGSNAIPEWENSLLIGTISQNPETLVTSTSNSLPRACL